MELTERRRKGSGGKLNRTETVTVRLDQKLRFGAELAARKQRRTLSSFIEWAVEQSLSVNEIGGSDNETRTLLEAVEQIWDVDEADRFVALASNYRDLLTYDEQVLWKLITTDGACWKNDKARLREHWDVLKKVAARELGQDALPAWEKTGKP